MEGIDKEYILDKVKTIYPCFEKANNVLQTSLENIGAMFHPSVLLFNAATIERNDVFWFYRDMTEQVAEFIENLTVRDWQLEKHMVLIYSE